LGVKNFVVVDPQRIDLTNVPRVTGSTWRDALSILTSGKKPNWVKSVGRHLSTAKVRIMKRLILRASPAAEVEIIRGDFVDATVCKRFRDCDYLFLAADSMQARLVFNALVHAYLIPGVQIGAKVPVDRSSGTVGDPYTVIRPVTPSKGCLLCNGLIPADLLQREAETAAERIAQRYVDDEDVVAPSVITLNAVGASHAVNDFMFAVTGLADSDVRSDYMVVRPRRRRITFERPRKDPRCLHCGSDRSTLLARGDSADLPTRES
jgi:molybdopterin/thiamine biosynthesis adenylyltransferase